ncbi:uncharacterized protein PHACADRAFT_207907 [Phanerochaete carnosa HHB-10118-sp]|uniref:Ricin B lectin domain-containing protein n=1 Tax=Phanerochaete carnosa (strain HHB-10118-sp) TaxID=650164 RepID=K5WBX7_PHACS|nr:uncharacterized protein PHACADRAFT_207907 [Phanerochaete carnosa HHB-10118-sp]EKM56715.1 hypothetical protein PHACADRAFT_207907 [Phanerochaete carnosa HHB-10118-sp]
MLDENAELNEHPEHGGDEEGGDRDDADDDDEGGKKAGVIGNCPLIISVSLAHLVSPATTHTSPTVQPGTYELKHASGLALNSQDAPVYNRQCDDALVLETFPPRLGKWEFDRVGDGYTIKQRETGLYCTLPQAGPKLDAPGCKASAYIWQLKRTGPISAPGNIAPGVYALKNKASKTYVALAPDEKTIQCWPEADLCTRGTKLWEIVPCGGGYTIKLAGTDKYCTLRESISWRSKVSVSSVPAAWKIVPADGHSNEGCFQIFWADTQMLWDLSGYGSSKPGTPVEIVQNKDSRDCRFFFLEA